MNEFILNNFKAGTSGIKVWSLHVQTLTKILMYLLFAASFYLIHVIYNMIQTYGI